MSVCECRLQFMHNNVPQHVTSFCCHMDKVDAELCSFWGDKQKCNERNFTLEKATWQTKRWTLSSHWNECERNTTTQKWVQKIERKWQWKLLIGNKSWANVLYIRLLYLAIRFVSFFVISVFIWCTYGRHWCHFIQWIRENPFFLCFSAHQEQFMWRRSTNNRTRNLCSNVTLSNMLSTNCVYFSFQTKCQKKMNFVQSQFSCRLPFEQVKMNAENRNEIKRHWEKIAIFKANEKKKWQVNQLHTYQVWMDLQKK